VRVFDGKYTYVPLWLCTKEKEKNTTVFISTAVAAASTSNLQSEEKLKSLNPSGEWITTTRWPLSWRHGDVERMGILEWSGRKQN
jgi:hypothetical protein